MLIFLKVLVCIAVPIQLFSTCMLFRYEKRKQIFRLPTTYMLPNGLMDTKMAYFVREGPGNKEKRIFWFCCTALAGAVVIVCICSYQVLA